MNTTCQAKPQTDHKDLVEKFANALAHYRVDLVEELLTEDGEYTYYELDGEDVEDGTKTDFINYLKWVCEPLRFTAAEPATVEYDQCLFCKVGNPVVLFNGGTFPYESQEFYERSRLGLMLEFKDGLICGVTFCGALVKSDSKYNFEDREFGDRHCSY